MSLKPDPSIHRLMFEANERGLAREFAKGVLVGTVATLGTQAVLIWLIRIGIMP